MMMMITKSRIHQLFVLTLVICCLTTAVNCGKITTKGKTKAVTETSGDVATTTTTTATPKSEVVATKADADNDDRDSNEDTDDDDDDAAEKNAVQSSDESLFSVWGIVRGVLNWIKDDISGGLFGADDDVAAEGRSDGSVEARTFGKIRRLQMALIPIIFKFGVLTAMVAFLVGIGLKTLFLVKVLLAMNALALLAKFFTLKTGLLPQIQYSAPPSWNPHHHVEYSAPSSWNWSPPSSAGWSAAPVQHEPEHHSSHPSKEIHLHIHGGAASQPKTDSYTAYVANPSQATAWQRSDPYSAYEPLLNQQNDLTVDATQSVPVTVHTDVPSNHRMF
uniref:Uncharacterized protein n=1 Tax=Musca domestica TaxID=7370 RepID=A0A1I8MXE1_MUSDO